MKITLIGFMGSGKTTIAQRLAEKLNLELIDMDALILEESGLKSINEIFDKFGEDNFREMENNLAERIQEKENIVISTGGGVVLNPETMKYLTKDSQVIYLKTGFDQAKKRISLKKIIPPLFQNIRNAKIILNIREPLYSSYANLTVDTDNKELTEVLDEIIVKLKG